MIHLKIPIPELALQKPTEIREAYINLFEDQLLYRADFTADEPTSDDDLDLPWEEVLVNLEIRIFKKNIVGTEKSYRSGSKVWCVLIIVSGMNSDIRVYFKKEARALDFVATINKWLGLDTINVPETDSLP